MAFDHFEYPLGYNNLFCNASSLTIELKQLQGFPLFTVHGMYAARVEMDIRFDGDQVVLAKNLLALIDQAEGIARIDLDEEPEALDEDAFITSILTWFSHADLGFKYQQTFGQIELVIRNNDSASRDFYRWSTDKPGTVSMGSLFKPITKQHVVKPILIQYTDEDSVVWVNGEQFPAATMLEAVEVSMAQAQAIGEALKPTIRKNGDIYACPFIIRCTEPRRYFVNAVKKLAEVDQVFSYGWIHVTSDDAIEEILDILSRYEYGQE